MTKRGIIHFALSILLLAYLLVGLALTSSMSAADSYRRLDIRVANAQADFVNADDINQELGDMKAKIASMRVDQVNTLDIENRIKAMDNIETANCMALNNGVLRLDVVPLIPVARVFDTGNRDNYYINRCGKRMKASTRYRIDTPVIVGDFTGRAQPTDALPVLDYMAAHPDLQCLASMVKVTRKGDIMIVPMMRGHIINFGDTSDIANKFDRLMAFYRQAMPVKGWEYYDTVTVKWRGQVVAKRRMKALPPQPLPEEDESDIDDLETMGHISPNAAAALEKTKQNQQNP